MISDKFNQLNEFTKSKNSGLLPHFFYCFIILIRCGFDTFIAKIKALWWGIQLGKGCSFHGPVSFKRAPYSTIFIGEKCKFNSAPCSNRIGVNRPCMISTLKAESQVHIGSGCGFSGTVIAAGKEIVLGDNVRCGANTLIMDTDWHEGDARAGPDLSVRIGNDVWLGVNVTVLKGVEIGNGTIVGAGSVVTSSLPGNVVAAGSPAKVLRTLK